MFVCISYSEISETWRYDLFVSTSKPSTWSAVVLNFPEMWKTALLLSMVLSEWAMACVEHVLWGDDYCEEMQHQEWGSHTVCFVAVCYVVKKVIHICNSGAPPLPLPCNRWRLTIRAFCREGLCCMEVFC